MEAKLKMTFMLSFGLLIAQDLRAWTGVRMRKSSAPPVPVSFSASTISSIRPGQKWQLYPTGGSTPYGYTVISGSGAVSPAGVYSAPTSATGSTIIQVTDSGGGTATTTIANSLAFLSMTNGALQIVADPEMSLVDSGGTAANYGDGENSHVIIRSDPSATNIVLTFDSFQTEGNYDYLKVYNGANLAGTQLGSYSGSSLPAAVTANGGAMMVSFYSDGNTNYSGYQAHWAISSPSLTMLHKSAYALDLGVDENMTASSGVGPYAFSIVSGGGSIATSGSDPQVGVFHPSVTPGDTTVRVTDSTGASFDQILTVATAYKLCTNASSTLSNGVLYSWNGSTGHYANSTTCGFVITPSSPGSGIQLNFDYLATESGYDFVKVYDGTSASGTLLASYSGVFPSTATLTATSGSMFIQMNSDSGVNSYGFRAVWKTLP